MNHEHRRQISIFSRVARVHRKRTQEAAFRTILQQSSEAHRHLQIFSLAGASSSVGKGRNHWAPCLDCMGDGQWFRSQLYSKCRRLFGLCGLVRCRAAATKENSLAYGDVFARTPTNCSNSHCSLFSSSRENPREQFLCYPKRLTASILSCEQFHFSIFRSLFFLLLPLCRFAFWTGKV